MNQRPASGGPWLPGREAAAFLGVKRATLYAYASRGLLRSERNADGAGRRYRREDLERLKARSDARAGHGAVAAGALRWGEPVLESALTAIDAGGPRYRGHRAVDLAAERTFEEVAELLWTGALPTESVTWSGGTLGVRAAPLAALLAEDAHPLTTLAIAVPALAASDPGRFEASDEAVLRRARALIVRMAALLGFARGGATRAHAAMRARSVAEAALVGLGVTPSARAVRAVDRVLVLMADHELNVSSFTVRVAASAEADLYACVSAGLASVSGPLHGGVCDRVEALLDEIVREGGARAVIAARERRGDVVPGFGHPLYPGGDPRAEAMMATARSLGVRRAAVGALFDLTAAMDAMGRAPPTSDIGLVAVSSALGLPPGSATALFALGRTAGWIAHVIEQRAAGFLLRPRARYTGPSGPA